MAHAPPTSQLEVSGSAWLMGCLELGVLAAVSIGAGLIGAVVVAANNAWPVVPTIAAISVVLVPGLLAHMVNLLAHRRASAAASLVALGATGIRLGATLAGVLVIVLTTSWGDQLAFWVPLVLCYLAGLVAETLFNLCKVGTR